MKILYLDATAGIAGDMTVAALLELGLPFNHLQQELLKLQLPAGSYLLHVKQVERRGLRGSYFEVQLPDQHHHGHHQHQHHDHHHHRSYADIRQMIADSDLGANTKELSQRIFLKLAEAEAQAHHVAVDQVLFHEVGAVDSIVDIVGVAIGLDWLKVEKIYCSAVPLGGGFVETAHGRLPVPAPATAALLKGLVVHSRCGDGERVTPTGAAILAALAHPLAGMPQMALSVVGHGAGSKDFEDCPNVLRAFLGDAPVAEAADKVVEAHCNLDDVTPEVIGYTQERLLEEGALDVWCAAIQMKKGRPAVQLAFLCHPERFGRLAELVMAETGTLGLRYQQLDRKIGERRTEERITPWGPVRCKLGEYGEKPEYEDCRAIAREHDVPMREVQRQATIGECRD